MRLFTLSLTTVLAAALLAVTVIAAIYVPQVAIYIPIIALGLALALQKYTASFIAYFVVTYTRIFDIGDRIRIGNIKGDVRHVGLLHLTLEEVGEDEKLGGELTGRLLYVPNLVILDQPVLNYSKNHSAQSETIDSDYIFDEVRIPITTDSNIEKASDILESIVRDHDKIHIGEAKKIFQNGYPKFLNEAINGTRVLIHIEPNRIWMKGKFVAPLRERNDVRTSILRQFLHRSRENTDIKLA
jgi:small-conductance mechanosensitive channel